MPLLNFCQRLDHFHDHSSIHNAVIVVVVVEVYVGAGDNEERLGGLSVVGRCSELVNRAAGFVEVRARGLRLIGILRVIPFARQREPMDGSGVEMVGVGSRRARRARAGPRARWFWGSRNSGCMSTPPGRPSPLRMGRSWILSVSSLS